MAQFVKVGKAADISNGNMKEYKIGEKTITVANADGEYFAFDGICTHAHCSLAGGFLDGYTVTCYCHGGMFDVSTGQVIAAPPTEPLGIYKVKIEGEDVLVEV